MEWLSELVKHITISRSFTGAVLMTSVTVVEGSKWFPKYLDALPKEWIPIAFLIAVFSGALLIFWAVEGVWAYGGEKIKELRSRKKSPVKLSEREFRFMQMLSECNDESLDLNDLKYGNGGLTKLETHELVDELAKQELIYRNGFGENLICMTAEGRRTVLAVQRQISPGQAPQSKQE